ncbi:Cytochrome p450 [Apiospora rasikravindrae]|uniref:Cytochrome p450 n=1 Tax=Apiospora rasikravindrae TaxID=990691 RepID=A0ABR1T5U0_9PEZI
MEEKGDYYYASARPTLLAMLSLALAGASFIYALGLAVYRLCLGPVAGFPGPRLAALSFWYEFYYDVVCGGRYWVKINELHDRYGPIIRINPYELHVRDPDFYEVLYGGPGQGRRDKWSWSVGMFSNSQSGFGTAPHDLHRLRRGALNPFFGKRAIARDMEPVIRGLVAALCARLEAQFRGTGEPLDVMRPYAALTTEVITRYAFDTSYGCVEDPGWREEWPRAMVESTKICHMNKQFPWLIPVMRAMPERVIGVLSPAVLLLIRFQKDLARQIGALMDESDAEKSGSKKRPAERPTIFHELIHNPDLPPEEKTLRRLVDEGQTMIAAGQETTSFFLKTVTYHVLADPAVHARLRAELRSFHGGVDGGVGVMGASVAQLERLPYLRAVVLEGHRFAHGVAGRLQRIAPDAPLRYGGWVIPAGTPVSMTSMLQHREPGKFPDPDRFDPERWLVLSGSSSSRRRKEVAALEKYLVPFGKGTRSCLGVNLATAEIYLTLAGGVWERGVRDGVVSRDDGAGRGGGE